MKVVTRLELEAKLLKYVRQYQEMNNRTYSVSSAASAIGYYLTDLMHKMWYFIKKNEISEQDVYKALRRLENQGFLVIGVRDGRFYITPPAPSVTQPSEEDIEISARDMRATKYKPSNAELAVAEAIARKYLNDREREKKLGIDALGNKIQEQPPKNQPRTNEISIEEDQASLEEYLKDE